MTVFGPMYDQLVYKPVLEDNMTHGCFRASTMAERFSALSISKLKGGSKWW